MTKLLQVLGEVLTYKLAFIPNRLWLIKYNAMHESSYLKRRTVFHICLLNGPYDYLNITNYVLYSGGMNGSRNDANFRKDSRATDDRNGGRNVDLVGG